MARRSEWRRPPWPFCLNKDSEQAQGLVLWLPHATSLRDLSPYARALTPGSAVVADDEMGLVRGYTAASSHSDSVNNGIVTDPPLAIMVWFNANDVTGGYTLAYVGDKDDNDSSQYMLQCRGDVAGDPVAAYTVDDAAGISAANTTTGYTAGTWNHAFGAWSVFNNRAAQLNAGGKATETTGRTVSGVDRVAVGATLDATPSRYFDGRLADLRIYARVPSDDEAYRCWHPRTRWDLYYPVGRRKTFFVAAAPGATGFVKVAGSPQRLAGVGGGLAA